MEFGKPHLHIREPMVLKPGQSQAVIDALGRRIVRPAGQWHLFIGDGDWVVETRFYKLRRDDLDPKAEEALRQMEGQSLIEVGYDKGAELLQLKFDLGAVLSIARATPSGRDGWAEEDQWTLFHEDGRYTSLDNSMRLKHDARR